MLSRYQELKKLASHEMLYRAVESDTQESVVIKIVSMDQEEDGVPPSTLREISFHRYISQPNIVSLRNVFCDDSNMYLVFEGLHTDLARYLATGRKLSQELILSYSYQLICGILQLHSNGIYHRNLCPECILLDKHGILKLSHLKSAQTIGEIGEARANCFEINYLAPEALIDEIPDEAAGDLWSAGCIIAEMLRGTPLFLGDCPFDQLMRICKMIAPPKSDEWPSFSCFFLDRVMTPIEKAIGLESQLPSSTDSQLISLLKSLLRINPRSRISAFEAIHHPAFDRISSLLVDLCSPLN